MSAHMIRSILLTTVDLASTLSNVQSISTNTDWPDDWSTCMDGLPMTLWLDFVVFLDFILSSLPDVVSSPYSNATMETPRPRIVSLLPSITEVLCELGLSEHIVGITHCCDYPLTSSTLVGRK